MPRLKWTRCMWLLAIKTLQWSVCESIQSPVRLKLNASSCLWRLWVWALLSILYKCPSPPLVKSSKSGPTFFSGDGDVLYWLMLRFSKQRPLLKGTVLYIGLCVCVWAAHGHMHTWRIKTSQQSLFPPLVSAHKASPWQLRQNLSTWKQSICFLFFFCLIFLFLIWSLLLLK